MKYFSTIGTGLETTRRGFTLVELLIVVTILVLILGSGLASFTAFNRRERLKQTALTFKSNLRLAQTKAISAEKPLTGCTEFFGMRIAFTASGYSMQHECTPEGLVSTVSTVVLPSGVSFLAVPSDFSFRALSGTANISADRTITFTNTNKQYSIVVSPNGNVSDMGFQ